MPIALIWKLRPRQAARLNPTLGRAAHAAILDLIHSISPAIADQLHAESQVRPLMVTPPLLSNSEPPVQVNPDQTYHLRVAMIEPSLESIAAHWEAAPPEQIRFGGATWEVELITSQASVHPWAGRASYAELIAAGADQRRWLFELAAPVTFRRKGKSMPLPMPELVFGSLLDRWNTYAPLQFPEDVRHQIVEHVGVGRVELRSIAGITKGGIPQIGSVGTIGYNVAQEEDLLAGMIETLARFAFYSGVGAGTARGFGLVRLVLASSRT
ncbi:MAG: CRISPR-associated endoribonuclease Cas6 [Roseiflexaceae bacterium]